MRYDRVPGVVTLNVSENQLFSMSPISSCLSRPKSEKNGKSLMTPPGQRPQQFGVSHSAKQFSWGLFIGKTAVAGCRHWQKCHLYLLDTHTWNPATTPITPHIHTHITDFMICKCVDLIFVGPIALVRSLALEFFCWVLFLLSKN